jgi:hypothetical protein
MNTHSTTTTKTPVPSLEPHCGSWIISRLSDGVAVLETFEKGIAESVNQELYKVETAAQYLGRLNERVRTGS